jgi:hypothetical protein
MPLIPYPNVPNVPGVPQVLRQFPSAPPAALVAPLGLASIIRRAVNPPVWGIFRPEERRQDAELVEVEGETIIMGQGTLRTAAERVVTPDSILTFNYKKEWQVTTSPTQQGGFADYNRVAVPFEVQLRLSKGGTEAQRREFLESIEDLNSTELYEIRTPEKTYFRCNLTRFEVARRGERGAFFLTEVDVFFREIRSVTPQYSRTQIANPKSASATAVQNSGTQQGQATTVPLPESVTE